MDMTVNVAGLSLKNPVILASGTAGYGVELSPFIDLNMLGGIVVKGLYPYPREGNPPPRIWETPCGLLNSIGLQGIGMERFAEECLPVLEKYDTAIFINACGEEDDDYIKVTEFFSEFEEIAGIELNLSCPNVREGGNCPALWPKWSYSIVKEARRATHKPLIAKLSPNTSSIVEVASACKEAGADAVSLVNTYLGMAVDFRTRRSRLSTLFGGVSGPAIKPLALRAVYMVASSVEIDVIGIGGITKGEDLLEFLLVGAKAIQVGSATLREPAAALRILEEAVSLLEQEGYNSFKEITGRFEIV